MTHTFVVRRIRAFYGVSWLRQCSLSTGFENMRAFTGSRPTTCRPEHGSYGTHTCHKHGFPHHVVQLDVRHGCRAQSPCHLTTGTGGRIPHHRSTDLVIVRSHAQHDFTDSPTNQDLNVRCMRHPRCSDHCDEVQEPLPCSQFNHEVHV